jgi:hypothetical protein
MAKSEIRAIHIWQADENLVCQRAGYREHDFAISIKNDEEPQNRDENSTPLRGRREGRNLGVVGYNPVLGPDKLRPCKHWCAAQPVDETGSGQA